MCRNTTRSTNDKECALQKVCAAYLVDKRRRLTTCRQPRMSSMSHPDPRTSGPVHTPESTHCQPPHVCRRQIPVRRRGK